MVYLFGWLGMLVSTLSLSVRGGRALTYFVLFYCCFIAFFRGDVGTDTVNYISILGSISDGEDVAIGEPGFKLLAYFLTGFFNSADIAVKSISIIFFFLLTIFFYRSNKNEAYFFCSYILPAFAYSYSMNGLRVGLAVAFFLVAIQTLSKKAVVLPSLKYFTLSFLFHYSAVLLPIFYFIYQAKWFKLSFYFNFIILLIVLIAVSIANLEYLIGKFNLYSDYKSPSVFSGSRVVIPLLLMLFFLFFGKLPLNEKFKISIVSFCLILLTVLLAQFSYAGLRVLDLLAILVPVVILMAYNKRNLEFDIYIKISFFISGLVVALATYLGFLGEYADGNSPFLPYIFEFNMIYK